MQEPKAENEVQVGEMGRMEGGDWRDVPEVEPTDLGDEVWGLQNRKECFQLVLSHL